MNNKRTARISSEVKREISKILRDDLSDPRLSTESMVSITDVEVTNDLSYADVYVSVLGDQKNKDDAIEAFNQAKGYIKVLIGERMRLRSMPEFRFKLDESIERGAYINKLIEETIAKDKKANENREN
uniref:30S ribosome-binding factor RbfA n=1 Tax=Anaerococcus mediterraneensis TaxID=1870984 RepID=UPI0009300D86|nr:30S ribosome-binding factor RbfA [Anaerococcus mediterraneensis]